MNTQMFTIYPELQLLQYFQSWNLTSKLRLKDSKMFTFEM